jgi:hypothetical protein
MKLNPNSTRPRIFETYTHPWYAYNDDENKPATLIKPNPPSKEAVERAKFVDKTYHWSGSDSVRPRNKRSSK